MSDPKSIGLDFFTATNNQPKNQKLAGLMEAAYLNPPPNAQHLVDEPEPEAASDQGFAGDVADAAQMGLAQAAGGFAETGYQITGSETLGDASQAFNSLAKDQIDQMSPEGQAAMQKQFFAEDENGDTTFGDAWSDPRSLALQFSTLTGQMVPQIAAGFGLGGLGAKFAGNVVAKAAARRAAAKGLTGEAATMYATNITRAAFGTAGQSLAGAGMAGGMIGNQARDEVKEMTDGELDDSDAFRELYYQLNDAQPELDVGSRRDMAKAMLAERVAATVQRNPGLIATNLVLDAAGGFFIDRLLRGVGTGGRLSNAGQQFVAQGVTEAGQGGMEQYALNSAMIEEGADPDRNLMQGVVANALNEGVMGGAFGGMVGGIRKGRPAEDMLPVNAVQTDDDGRAMQPIQQDSAVQDEMAKAVVEQPTMSLDDALAQIKAERGQYRGIDDDIRIAEEQGFTDEAVRLRAAKRNFEMAADMVAENDLEGAQRFRERGMKIYRDVMEVAAPEYKGGLPAEYVAVGEMVGRAEQLPVPAQAQNGETYEEIETLMPEVADYEPDPARAIPASVDAPYYMETTAEAKAAKAATERAFTEQQGKQPGVRPPVADVDEIPADAESIVLGDVPPPVAEVAELPPLVDVEETNDIPYQRPDIPVSETLQLADEAVPGADAIDFSDDGRADRLAENVQDQIRKHKQPKGLDDGRLLRESFRNQLNHMANRLVRGGGIVQMVDKSGRVTGRTKSLNPDWFQNAPDNVKRLGVQGLQIAVRRSLAGKDLGKGQARAVRYLLDVFTDERNDYARDYLKPERENVLKFRKVMRGQMTAQEAGFVDADTPLARSVGAKQVELSDILEPEILEESFDDDALDSMGRALAEIMQNAKNAGVSDQVLVKAAQEYGHDPIALGMIIEELTERASNGNEITPASIEGFSAGGALEEESAEAEKSAGSGKRKSGAEKSVEPPDAGRASEKNIDEETPAAAGVSVSEARLTEVELLREYRDRWQYKFYPGGSWKFASSKESAVKSATEAYQKAKPDELLTRDQRNLNADREEYESMDSRFSEMGREEIERTIKKLDADSESLRKVGQREFNGNGGRRTGAAVASEGSRRNAEERAKLQRYYRERFGEEYQGPSAIRNSAGNPFKNIGSARIALKKHPDYEIAKVGGGYELRRIPEGAATATNGNMAEPPRTGALDMNDDLAGDIDAAANEAATSPLNDKPEPTAAQIEAGNYEKGHVSIQGLDVAIENPRGSQRSGTDPDGKAWSVTMAHHYGYLKKTEGADGEHIDVYLGKNPESEKVFIVDQVNADGSFDEHKVMLGFTDKAKAIAGYKANYEKGWKVGPVTELTIQQFKGWIAAGDTEKPLTAGLSKAADQLPPHEAVNALMRRLNGGDAVPASEVLQVFESVVADPDATKAALAKLKKAELINHVRGHVYSDTKKDQMVRMAYSGMVQSFRFIGNNSGVVTWSHGDNVEVITQEHIKSLSDADIAAYAADRKALIDEKIKAHQDYMERLKNPQTLEDYRRLIQVKGIDLLSVEQRATYDRLTAEKALEEKPVEAVKKGLEADGEIKTGEPEEGRNSKTGETIFNVKVIDRLGTDKFKEAAAFSRRMKGGYWKGNFYFPSVDIAQQFREWLNGKDIDLTEQVVQRLGEKKARATARLQQMADRMKEAAEAELNTTRRANTIRQADMAASAVAKAEGAAVTAEVMRRVADGEAPLLSRMTEKVQAELLARYTRGLVHNASADLTDRDNNGNRFFKADVTPEQMVSGAQMPLDYMYADSLEYVARDMEKVKGHKQAAASLRTLIRGAGDDKRIALNDRVRERIMNFASKHGESYMTYTDVSNQRKRLERMGITSLPVLRAALVEYINLKNSIDRPKKNNRLDDMEQALKRTVLGNRKAFNDFFPTPNDTAAEVVDLADIQPGMAVLEPSAGNGMLADAIKDAGGNVDVVEMAGQLREILQEKGHNLIGNDFLELPAGELYDRIVMNPPFSKNQDIDHVTHAYSMLKPGGRIVAIVSSLAGERSDGKNKAFRNFLNAIAADEQALPEGAFKSSLNPTGVNTKVLIIDKPESGGKAKAELEDGEATEVLFSLPRDNDPGLQKAIADRLKEMAQIAKDKGPSNPVDRSDTPPMAEYVRKWIAGVEDDLGVKIEVVETKHDLPESVKADLGSAFNEVEFEGFYNTVTGRTYLIASHLTSRAAAVRAALHEALGHGAVINFIEAQRENGGKALDQVLDDIYQRIGKKLLMKKIQRYNLDLSKERDRRDAVLEYIAHVAEEGKQMGLVRRVVAALRDLIRKVYPGIGWNDTDTLALIAKSKLHLQQEGTRGAKTSRKVLMQLSPDGDAATRYREELGKTLNSKRTHVPPVSLGRTPDVLRAVGAPDLDLVIRRDVVRKATNGVKHTVPFSVIERLPELLADPIAVFESNTQSGALVVLVDAADADGNPVVVPIHLEKKVDRLIINDISSVYGKDRAEGFVRSQKILYLDLDKQTDLVRLMRLQLPGSGSPDRSGQNVITKADLVNSGAGFKPLFRLSDAIENDSTLSQSQKDFLDKIGPKSVVETAADRFREVTDRWRLKVRQGLADRFAGLLELDKQLLNGDVTSPENITKSAWVKARMSNVASGVVTAMMNTGRIYLDSAQGVVDVREGTDGLVFTLNKLGSAAEVEKFMGWIAANRAEKLMAEGRENLFTADEIAAGKELNTGVMPDGRDRGETYTAVFDEFQQYRDDVLAIAEEAGVISGEAREMWRDEFYVPFYRLDEGNDDVSGPRLAGGLSRQQAYKKLKGGSQNLNDLLQNTIMNFHHLIDASMKNLAATQALDNAAQLDVAEETQESIRDKKQSTFILRNGQKAWYNISDPLVFQALTSLNHTGMNGTAMNVMRSFKRVFTNMTTSTPQFIVANLIRDSLSAISVTDLKANPAGNVMSGLRGFGVFDRNGYQRARLLASGGAFSFGHAYGEDADSIRFQIDGQMRRGEVLRNPKSLLSFGLKPFQAAWDRWQDVNNSFENANRMAAFQQNEDAGKGKLYSAFQARDLMDFSGTGAWPAVRFLTDVVPFLNARLQGLDKLYRSGVKPSAKVVMQMLGVGSIETSVSERKSAARFMAVVGALSLATMALYLRNRDDDDYQKAEDWMKDTYWWVRIPGTEHVGLIPKPFEVGAIATLTERLLEQAVDDKANGELFMDRIGHMLGGTFAFSPIPQMFQPTFDVYANKDSFTGRDIETMGQQRLSPSKRVTDRTSLVAEMAGKGTEAIFGADSAFALSPVQIDYLISGYLGQVGAWMVGHADVLKNVLSGNDAPAKNWYEHQPIRRFYRNFDDPQADKQTTLFYEALRESSRLYADYKQLKAEGESAAAKDFFDENQGVMVQRASLGRVNRKVAVINARIKQIKGGGLSADEKRRQIDLLQLRKKQLIERVIPAIEAAM